MYGSASIYLEGMFCIKFCIIFIYTLLQSWESSCICHWNAQTVLTILVPGRFCYPPHIARGFIILYSQYFMDLCYECLLFRICHWGKANSRRGALDLWHCAKPKLFFIIINIALVTVQRWVVSAHLQMTLWRWAAFVMILVSGFLAALIPEPSQGIYVSMNRSHPQQLSELEGSGGTGCSISVSRVPAQESGQLVCGLGRHPRWWHIKRTQSIPFLSEHLSLLLALGDAF